MLVVLWSEYFILKFTSVSLASLKQGCHRNPSLLGEDTSLHFRRAWKRSPLANKRPAVSSSLGRGWDTCGQGSDVDAPLPRSVHHPGACLSCRKHLQRGSSTATPKLQAPATSLPPARCRHPQLSEMQPPAPACDLRCQEGPLAAVTGPATGSQASKGCKMPFHAMLPFIR